MEIVATTDRTIIIELAIKRHCHPHTEVQIIEECIVFKRGSSIYETQVTPAMARFIAEPTAKIIAFEIEIPERYMF